MVLEISVISSEIIKPSSPTPPHLINHNLSFIDQYVPSVPVSCILFYPALTAAMAEGVPNPTSTLKSSLSETLADFYPLSGRISDNTSIQCNDAGVNFFETRVMGRNLDRVVSDALGDEMEQLLPNDNFQGSGPKVLLSIQLNRFDCGGMAMGVCIAHKASDSSSLCVFLQNWAARARGDYDKMFILRPKYDISSLFPGKDSASTVVFPTGEPNQIFVTKRFVFLASDIAALKAKCINNGNVKNPTRVQVITALIWRSALNALRMTKADVKAASLANLAVNLRGRLIPPLSNQYVGNLAMLAMAISPTNETDLNSLVDIIRTTIASVNNEFVRRIQSDEKFLAALAQSLNEVVNLEVYTISSWCRFPFYETDFGWGMPAWTSTARLVPNCAILLDTKDGDGVEAWVALNEHEMAKFESDPDIIEFTSHISNILV